MAPVTKLRTYNRSSKGVANNSVDAVNRLFAKNREKGKRNKKKNFERLIKELPQRPRGETLLGDDESLHVSTEDTFDKLVRGSKNKKQSNSESKKCKNDSLFKQTNTFNSPIMTRSRKRTALIVEISNNSASSLDVKKFRGNIDCPDFIPHLTEPTVDKIDFSLEIEKEAKPAPKSLSYIKLPNLKEGEVSEIVRENAGVSKIETSFDPIFTKTFRERQMIHCSTPLVPAKPKQKIINNTISPIKNVTFCEKSTNELKNIETHTNISLTNCSSIENNSENVSKLVISDLKLRMVPKVLLRECADIIHDCLGVQNSDNILNSPKSRKSFITLRRRKVLKTKDSQLGRKSKRSRDVTKPDLTINKIGEMLSKSLSDFKGYDNRNNGSIYKSSVSAHSLHEFESFCAQYRHILGSVSDDVHKNKTEELETPKIFVTKRRRRLTDSCLPHHSFETSKNRFQRSKRRLSIQETSSVNFPVFLKDLAVVVPKFVCSDNETENLCCTKDISSLIPMIDCGSTYLSSGDQISHSTQSDNEAITSSLLNKFKIKDLLVNITKGHFYENSGNTNDYSKKIQEASELLFINSDSVSMDKDQSNSKSSGIIPNLDKNSNKLKDHTKKGSILSDHSKNSNRTERQTEKSELGMDLNIYSLRSKSINKMPASKRTRKKTHKKNESVEEDSIEQISDSVDSVSSSNSLIKNYSYHAADFEQFSARLLSASIDNVNTETVDTRSSPNNHTAVLNSCKSIDDNTRDMVVNKNGDVSETALENIYVNVTKRSGSRNVLNNEKRMDKNAQEFENFYLNHISNLEDCITMLNEAQSAPTVENIRSTEEIENISTILKKSTSESDANNFVMNENNSVANIDYNKIEEESLVHVTETPKNIVDGECKIDSTLIDLTVSVDECQPHKISEELKIQPIEIDKSVDEGKTILQTSELSDIIESSIQEISQVDSHSFKIPLAGNVRKRHSKTMLLKAGKLWRRSLAIHKRSNLMLSYVNVPPCKVGDGSLCICSMCTVSKETTKRLSHRRCSIRIVPAYPVIDPSKETSILESYAHSASYVSDQIFDDNLEDNLRSLSLSQRGSFIQDPAPVTARELVLRRCGQTEPILFEECYPKSVLQHCQKIGEGVYGEVFLFRNPNGGTSVIKVIPIEGDQIVNGERQKKFEEIFSEIIIAQELSNLRNNKQNMTSGFSEVQKVQCVQGRYPEKLLDLWDLYDETRGSENDSPEIFDHNQLYIVLQLANGGQDLEAFIFTNASQAFSMFQQVACALAIAEEHMHFEHRDLHWGNVLLSDADRNKKINFRLDGKNYEIMAKGIEVAIIDFTLSRIEHDGVVIFNDLSLDPDLFTAEGDYQFEIYKLMQQKNGNNWQRFEPYSNVLWLHYILDKAITALRYKNVQTKVHKEYIAKLKQLKNDIFKYGSVKEFVLNNF